MKTLWLGLKLLSWVAGVCYLVAGASAINSTAPRDMYVVRATVYQVGILTNKSGNGSHEGNQEALTLYRNHGSAFDISNIHNPVMTNVTAQSVTGLAPVIAGDNESHNMQIPWTSLEKLASLKTSNKTTDNQGLLNLIKSNTFERDVSHGIPVKISSGSAVIPQDEGVSSLALPPLLALNNNLSHIPVPIPNMSIVRYAKINTIVKAPQKTVKAAI